MNIGRLLHLDFIPASKDLGLLLVRVALGAAMVMFHGLGKLKGFADKVDTFPDPLGITRQASLGLAVFAEVVCAALLVVGLFSRFAAFNLVVTMGVAFFLVHGGALAGPKSGELAFVYLVGFAAIMLGGAGRFSLDSMLFGKK